MGDNKKILKEFINNLNIEELEYNDFDYLQNIYDSRADFYKKAKVYVLGEFKILVSYATIVAGIYKNEYYVTGWYSQTTARHINEFLLQNDFNKITKKEMEGEI